MLVTIPKDKMLYLFAKKGIWEACHLIDFKRLVKTCAKRTDFDASIASGYAIMAVNTIYGSTRREKVQIKFQTYA
jgi:hypothetical protein